MGYRISSRNTLIFKWVFPIAWVVFVSVAASQISETRSVVQRLVIAAALIAVSTMVFLVMRASVRDLVDEVYDEGDHLLIRRKGLEARIAFENIMNVSFTQNTNPSRITLQLVKPCALGSSVSFSPLAPSLTSTFTGRRSIGEDLMRRAYAARATHAG
jgi:hypothetical protein